MSKKPEERTPLAIHFIAGGAAGLCEALACHPLGIIPRNSADGRYDQGLVLLTCLILGPNAAKSKSKVTWGTYHKRLD